jgi:hypothetical protein
MFIRKLSVRKAGHVRKSEQIPVQFFRIFPSVSRIGALRDHGLVGNYSMLWCHGSCGPSVGIILVWRVEVETEPWP